MSTQPSELLQRFEECTLDTAAFGHHQHVAVAYEMLERYGFVETVTRYGAGIRALADAAGAPDKYNETVTVAFLALIAERKATSGGDGFGAFIDRNPDLLDKNVLARWYSVDRLYSELARRTFLLPDKAA